MLLDLKSASVQIQLSFKFDASVYFLAAWKQHQKVELLETGGKRLWYE